MNMHSTIESRAATLPEITAAFDALPERQQLLLIDYLADRIETEIDMQKAARDWAGAQDGSDKGDVFERLADDLIPQGICPPQVWNAHREKRDEALSYYLNAISRRAA